MPVDNINGFSNVQQTGSYEVQEKPRGNGWKTAFTVGAGITALAGYVALRQVGLQALADPMKKAIGNNLNHLTDAAEHAIASKAIRGKTLHWLEAPRVGLGRLFSKFNNGALREGAKTLEGNIATRATATVAKNKETLRKLTTGKVGEGLGSLVRASEESIKEVNQVTKKAAPVLKRKPPAAPVLKNKQLEIDFSAQRPAAPVLKRKPPAAPVLKNKPPAAPVA